VLPRVRHAGVSQDWPGRSCHVSATRDAGVGQDWPGKSCHTGTTRAFVAPLSSGAPQAVT